MHIGIIGGGPAGYVAASYAAIKGAQVTLVEKQGLGGTCLHRGCIPTKRLVSSSHLLDKIKHAEKFGIKVPGLARPHWEKMREGMTNLINRMEGDLRSLMSNRKVLLIDSMAKPVCSGERVGIQLDSGELIGVDRLLICTGSIPHRPVNFPFDNNNVCTSDEIWQWQEIPESLIIVGEGVIACEFAFIFKAMGVDISMLGMMDKPLPNMDKSISTTIQREMKKKKIRFKGGRGVTSLSQSKGNWQAFHGDELLAKGQRVLVCTGRTPYTQGLELEGNDIAIENDGCIRVNKFQQTSTPRVYAAGDVCGGIMLAHAASEQARIAVDHMFDGKGEGYDVGRIPSAVFTNPEVASVGLSEDQALQQGLDITCGLFDLRGLGKAQAMGEIAGGIKLIVESESRRLIGAHMVGANVTEIIHEAAVIISRQGSVDDILVTVHAHPTLSEAVFEAAEDIFGHAIHKPIFN